MIFASMKEEKRKSIVDRFLLFFERSKEVIRIIVLDNDTFEEKRVFVFSRVKLFVYLVFGFILTLVFSFIIISFSSLKTIIPGYPNPVELQFIKSIADNNLNKLDSLEKKMVNEQLYLDNLKLILMGMPPRQLNSDSLKTSDNIGHAQIDFNKSSNDSLLRSKIEQREKYDISSDAKTQKDNEKLNGVLFFPPLKGEVTNKIDIKKGHYGVDIIAVKNEAVKSVLNGTVVYHDWSPENGHVIHVQHQKNLISVYRHNASLLKKTGDYIKAGDPIAIVGNSGELSTGPHLHLELWHNGIPIDPEKFIVFK